MKHLKHLLMLVALLTYSHGLWAYARAYVANGCAGKGYVYLTTVAGQKEISDITDSQWQGESIQVNVGGNQSTQLPNVGTQWYVYAKPYDGCTFKGWSYENSVDGEIESTDPKYLATYLGSGDQNLYAIFEGEGLQTIPITVVKEGDANGGTITVANGAMKGDKVTITQSAATGYGLSYLYAKDAENNDVTITYTSGMMGGGNTISFIMPATEVTLYAKFGKLYRISDTHYNTSGNAVGNVNFYQLGVGKDGTILQQSGSFMGGTITPRQAPEGATVRIAVLPGTPFYKMTGTPTLVDSNNVAVDFSETYNNHAIFPNPDTIYYQYTMPDTAVVFTVTHDRCNVEVPTTEINKGKDGRYYATFWANGGYRFTIPSGVRAETYKVADGELVVSHTWNEGDILPPTQAVVLSSETSDNMILTPHTASTTGLNIVSDSESMLMGTSSTTTTTATDSTYQYYILATAPAGKEDLGIGFYWQQDGGYRLIRSAAYRAYLRVPVETAAGAKGWAFGDGKTTGIEGIKNEELRIKNSFWYTLDGRRVAEPTQKGIYIHNGKKVVVK